MIAPIFAVPSPARSLRGSSIALLSKRIARVTLAVDLARSIAIAFTGPLGVCMRPPLRSRLRDDHCPSA
jgi:hypothetical protein